MEAETSEAVQMPPLLQLQKLPGKGDGGWKKKVSLHHFLAEDHEFVEKNMFWASTALTSYCLLPNTF